MKTSPLAIVLFTITLAGCVTGRRFSPDSAVPAIQPAEVSVAPASNEAQSDVKRPQLVASFDVKATPFGLYDATILATVQKRWYDLLQQSTFSPRAGKVVIEFRLHSDGRITDLNVTEENVGDILTVYCRRAISDPAPFAPWPRDMKRLIGKEYRDLKFTFYYPDPQD